MGEQAQGRPPAGAAAGGTSGDARESWEAERESAFLYEAVAASEAGTAHAELFRRLGGAAARQAAFWAERARDAGHPLPPTWRPRPRARLVAWLVRRLGARPMRGVLVAMKLRGLSVFGTVPAPDSPWGHGPKAEARRHRGVESGGNLRAAVFGANDGLLSNASLILGVAGGSAEPSLILLSGVAGLLAGAFSMAAGEYVSVRSQRELFEHQIALERAELEAYPEEEAAELALIYEARGLPAPEAERVAQRIVADPERALDALAREELGLAPDQLASPWGAAGFSFAAFAAGASLPLLPFLTGAGRGALPVAIGLTALALFGLGAALSLFTGRGPLAGGLRLLAIGAAAGAATWSIGALLGAAIR
jgi:vacuolar iron transporter family protein